METFEEREQRAEEETAATVQEASVDSASPAAVKNLAAVNTEKKTKFFSTKNIVKLAVFTALSYVLYMFLKTPLPISRLGSSFRYPICPRSWRRS